MTAKHWGHSWPDWMPGLLPNLVSWATVGAVAMMLLAGIGARCLAEWQRRRTLIALVQHAPGGTVVVQERGVGGPAMWVQIGHGPRQISPPYVHRLGD
ncbi:hypothetical protein Airi02_093410 [Actinoallomurus iriomotensis]|uniref:Uncharacterized protein n=1 Tax=Actinoallomurus iriomotensis TaxID=478107 RepID=A0A9W6SEP1_9ACTN|nr:hypothetical protein Airi02_093410 [Actinoallomurus iriomotensis]